MPARSVPKPTPPKVSQIKPVQMVSRAGVTYSVENVSPSVAEEWLATNHGNRSKRTAGLNKFARDMAAGAWDENGSAIVFDKGGALIDGQNRLEACVVSKCSFTTLVVRGVARDVQNTIDDGAKRTLADRFTFTGHKNANAAAAITRRILLWQAGYKTNTGTYQPTTREALELVDRDPTVVAAVEIAVGMRGTKLLPPSIIGLSWWLFWAIDADDCQEFWNGLHTGAGLATGSPILVLRNQVIAKAAEPGRIPESVILAWVIKAWNDWRASRERTRAYSLRPGELFPEPR